MNTTSDLKSKLTFTVTVMVALTLCISVIVMVSAFVFGLWAKEVDNAEIFKLISPAFQTIIGGFIGLLAGVKLSHDEEEPRCKKDSSAS
jgi:undecaprenyl pyrophosphate phosphatase UppP